MRSRVGLVALVAACFFSPGCSDASKVNGLVTLDGTPVEGASVVFVSESGNETYTGRTDAKGEFTVLSADQKSGAKPGTYKVLVTKLPPKEPMSAPAPGEGGSAAAKEMQAASKGASPKGAAGMPNPMMGRGSQAPIGVKSELPAVYASAESTPLRVKIPMETKQLVLELKSK
jgi:hypothetical protein